MSGSASGTGGGVTASNSVMRDSRRPGRGAVLAGGAALVAALLAGCGEQQAQEAGDRDGPAEAPASLPQVDLSRPPVANDPDPSVRAGAVADFIDCRYGVWQGGWTADFGPLGSGPSADGALADMMAGERLGMPDGGFVAVGQDGGRVLYVHEVAGSPKAALVIADSTRIDVDTDERWAIETFASCDPAEFDPSDDDSMPRQVWRDADGNRLPTSVIASAPGPEHCGWDSMTFLTADGEVYISDPHNVLRGRGFVAAFDADAVLPADAVDTGFRLDDRHLWMSADRLVAYVVTDDAIEAWPSSTAEFVCY